jgi:hypothetical protein
VVVVLQWTLAHQELAVLVVLVAVALEVIQTVLLELLEQQTLVVVVVVALTFHKAMVEQVDRV